MGESIESGYEVDYFYYCDKQYASKEKDSFVDDYFIYRYSGRERKLNPEYEMYSDICEFVGIEPKSIKLNGLDLDDYYFGVLEYHTDDKVLKMKKQVKRLDSERVVSSHVYSDGEGLYTVVYNCKQYTKQYSDSKPSYVTPGSIGESMYEDACTIAGLEYK